jgi:hypothetical protein
MFARHAIVSLAILLVGGCDAGKVERVSESEPTIVAPTAQNSPEALGSPEAPGTTAPTVFARDIDVAHTPDGGWRGAFPDPVLARCSEPLVTGAPDLRGMWKVIEVVNDDGASLAEHNALGHLQRIEQCGDRLVVTAGGIIHDMRCDGTEAHGVHDVAEFDKTTPITVVATYEEGTHVLRPVGLPIEVTRRREGAHVIWKYLGFTATMERIGPPEMQPLAEDRND